MSSSTLLRELRVGRSVLVLFFLISFIPSCAIRYKGMKGIKSSQNKSVAFTDTTIVKLPDYYLNFTKGEDKVTPLLFTKDPEAKWVIQEINYKRVPFVPLCGTGLVGPVLLSWATLGIIPIAVTDELKGHLVIKNKQTSEIKSIDFHAKKTISFSLWNKLKIGKDPEWTGKEKFMNDEYYRKFLESKMP